MDEYVISEVQAASSGYEPLGSGLFSRPDAGRAQSFRAFLQTLAADEPREPRSFGGWRNGFRCERATSDLLFLIYDRPPRSGASALADRILQGASQFGYSVEVDQIERREVAGWDVFAIRETSGKAFATRPWRR